MKDKINTLLILKNILFLIAVLTLSISSNAQVKTKTAEVIDSPEIAYASLGIEINDKDALSIDQMYNAYEGMKLGDTLTTKMAGKVASVCQMKGCWMTLNLEDGNQVMVKFKDYGFFVPKDISGKEVVINGIAYVEETSVDDQRHIAEDAGKSEGDMAAITAPKKTFVFEADGVLIKQ